MVLHTFIAIDCIVYAVCFAAIISLFPNKRPSSKIPAVIAFIYFLLENIFSWLDTTTLADSINEDKLTIFFENTVDIVFFLIFFACVKKGSPVLNYIKVYIYSIIPLPILAILSICRKLMLPQVSGLALTDSRSDFPSLLVFLLSYIFTLAVARLTDVRLTRFLQRVPHTLLIIVLLVYVVIDIAVIAMLPADELNVSNLYYMAGIFAMLGFYSIIIALFLAIIVYRYREEHIAQGLIRAESQLIHNYYSDVMRIHTQLRHLRHDMNNHITLISMFNQYDPQCDELRQSIGRLVSELKTQLDEMMPPRLLSIDRFTPYENYILWQSIEDIGISCGLPANTIAALHTSDTPEHETLRLCFPEINSLSAGLVRSSHSFQLIGFLAESHNGSAKWKKEDKIWTLRIDI